MLEMIDVPAEVSTSTELFAPVPSMNVTLAPAPVKLTSLLSERISLYVPAAILIVSPADALPIVPAIVRHGGAGERQLFALLPPGATYSVDAARTTVRGAAGSSARPSSSARRPSLASGPMRDFIPFLVFPIR